MRVFTSLFFGAALSLSLSACGFSGPMTGSRDFVQVVGSLAVHPFAEAVAQQVARNGGPVPIVESSGTNRGMQLFCGGSGSVYPDIVDASRRMHASEYDDCRKNGVTDIVELQVGLDGIAFAEARQGPDLRFTPDDVYKALAANPFGMPNTAKLWSDVNPRLPAIPILVYGPRKHSGTRDALAKLILAKGCDSDAAIKMLRSSDPVRHHKVCTELRSDGAYVESDVNDIRVVEKVAQNPKAVGIFVYSDLEQNSLELRGIAMSGVMPRYRAIADFSYPGARPLFIYVKKARLNAVEGLSAYVSEWTRAWSPDGYLRLQGLVAETDDVRARNRDIAAKMALMDPSSLK